MKFRRAFFRRSLTSPSWIVTCNLSLFFFEFTNLRALSNISITDAFVAICPYESLIDLRPHAWRWPFWSFDLSYTVWQTAICNVAFLREDSVLMCCYVHQQIIRKYQRHIYQEPSGFDRFDPCCSFVGLINAVQISFRPSLWGRIPLTCKFTVPSKKASK